MQSTLFRWDLLQEWGEGKWPGAPLEDFDDGNTHGGETNVLEEVLVRRNLFFSDILISFVGKGRLEND